MMLDVLYDPVEPGPPLHYTYIKLETALSLTAVIYNHCGYQLRSAFLCLRQFQKYRGSSQLIFGQA